MPGEEEALWVTKILMVGLILYVGVSAWGRELSESQRYLGATAPSAIPQVLPISVRDGWFATDRLAITTDGQEIYFSEAVDWNDPSQYRIRMYRFENFRWEGPLDLFEGFIAPALSPDGKTLYLQTKQDGVVFTWRSRRTEQGWAQPEAWAPDLPVSGLTEVRSGRFYGVTTSEDSVGWGDLCVLDPSTDNTFHSLGRPVCTSSEENDFFVAPDESYVVFATYGTARVEHPSDIMISFQRPNHTWTEPVSVGPLINDSAETRWGPSVSPDGKYLFYATGYTASTGHILWVRFDAIREILRLEALQK